MKPSRVRSQSVSQNPEELGLGFCFATSEDIHPHEGIRGREAVPIPENPQDPWEQRTVRHPGTPENTRGKSRIDWEETYPTYVSKARMSRRVETLRNKNSGVTRNRFGNTNRQGGKEELACQQLDHRNARTKGEARTKFRKPGKLLSTECMGRLKEHMIRHIKTRHATLQFGPNATLQRR